MLDLRQADEVEIAVARAPKDPETRRLFEVWLRWDGSHEALCRKVKPPAVLETFTMLWAGPSSNDPAVWRCVFEHRGREITFDSQTLALLRRLAPIAVWIKAERKEGPAADQEIGLDDAWRDFGRRALP